MTRFSKQFWKKSRRSRKSAFGGEVKSKEEIEALNKKIKVAEKKEFEAFEVDFDEALDDL